MENMIVIEESAEQIAESCPCSCCDREAECKYSPCQCPSFRYWFHRSWRAVTLPMKEQRKDYFRFRIVYKN